MTNTPRSQDPRPNVVIVIMDDLAFGDLSCHGNPHTSTPNLDALHDGGVRLTRYCSGPVCTPARAALMTGRHPYRTGAIDTYCGRSIMHPEERTLAQVLRDAGYATGISGKWHLGDCYPSRAMDFGFDEALVHNGGGLRQPSNWGEDSYENPDLMHNGKLERHYGYCTDIFGDHAASFIDQHKDEPFFLYMGTNCPHSPFEVPDAWAQKFRDQGVPEKWARIYGMVENIDANVGKLMGKLDEHGIADNTIFIYTSDHGPCGSAQADGEIRFNAGLRSQKGTMYQGGIKVPMFIRWPEKIAAGKDVEVLSNPIDLLPTLAGPCGAQVPSDRTIDGIDLMPFIAEGSTEYPERTVCMQWHRGDAAERYRNYCAVDQRYKLMRPGKDGADELFDLVDDPGEQNDLAASKPDVVERLKRDYDAWFDDVGPTSSDATYDAVPIHIGSPHENPTVLTRQDWRVHGDDGWSDQRFGYWVVRAEKRGPYRMVVRYTPGDEEGEMAVTIGDQTITALAPAGEPSVTLEGVEMPEGINQIEGRVRRPGGEISVVRIEVGH